MGSMTRLLLFERKRGTGVGKDYSLCAGGTSAMSKAKETEALPGGREASTGSVVKG